MTGAVLDASAAIDLLIGHGEGVEAEEWHSHAGLDIEVFSVLRRVVQRELLAADAARETLDHFLGLAIERHALQRLLPRVWDLRHDISAYDAGYVALAEALGLPLITLDRRLATTAVRYCDVIVS